MSNPYLPARVKDGFSQGRMYGDLGSTSYLENGHLAYTLGPYLEINSHMGDAPVTSRL